MISVDVETSGIDPQKCTILSIGAVDMADPDNRFYGECRPFEGAQIEQQALDVNGFDFDEIHKKEKSESELITEFVAWVKSVDNNKPVMCGQNVSFDRDFIRFSCERNGFRSPFNFRVVDLHSVAWYFITVNGSKPPKNLSLNRVLEMTGSGREPEPHNALTGAMCAAECISRLITRKSLFPGEFESRV